MFTFIDDWSKGRSSEYFSLIPGAQPEYDPPGSNWWKTGAIHIHDELWQEYLEDLARNCLTGYDRYGLIAHTEADWRKLLALVASFRRRVRRISSADLVDIELPELSARERMEIKRGFPATSGELDKNFQDFEAWCEKALEQRRCITLYGI